MAGIYILILTCLLINVRSQLPDFGCLEPGHRPNSLVKFEIEIDTDRDRYPTSTKVSYKCAKHFEMIGHNMRVCQRNGTWSGKAPICGVNVTTNVNISGSRPNVVDAYQAIDSINSTCSTADVSKTPASWHVVLHSAHNVSVIRVVAKNDNPHMESVVIKVSVKVSPTANYTSFVEESRRFYFSTASNESHAVYELFAPTPIVAKYVNIRVESGLCSYRNECLEMFYLCELAVFSETSFATSVCKTSDEDNRVYGLYGRKCYSLHHVSGSYVKWTMAYCPPNSTLAQHIDFDESLFVNRYISRTVGDAEYTSLFWIGGQKRSQTTQWQWLDGSPVIMYTTEPRNYFKNNKPLCLQFRREKSSFESDYCDDKYLKYWLCAKYIMECGIPEQKPSTLLVLDGVTAGSLATYSCPKGHMMKSSSSTSSLELSDGQFNRICMSDGQWSHEAPQCEYVDCGPLPVQGGRSITRGNGTSSWYGSWAQVECDFGLVLSSGFEINHCDQDGNWKSHRADGVTNVLSPAVCSPIESGCVWMTDEDLEARILQEVIVNIISITAALELFVLVCAGIFLYVVKVKR